MTNEKQPLPSPTPYACALLEQGKQATTGPSAVQFYEDARATAVCARLDVLIEQGQRMTPYTSGFLQVLPDSEDVTPVLAPPPEDEKDLSICQALVWGTHHREGRRHLEWHAPCGCAYHPEGEQGPHVHPCSEHARPEDPRVIAQLEARIVKLREGLNYELESHRRRVISFDCKAAEQMWEGRDDG